MSCCVNLPCHFPCDPPIPAHGNEFGCAEWVRNFCKHPAKAGEKFQLTDTFLKPGHMVHYVSYVIEIPSKTPVPFTIGTMEDPAKYGGGNLHQNSNGVLSVPFFAASAADALVTNSEGVFVTIGADCNEGILGIKFMLSDAKPIGTRLGF